MWLCDYVAMWPGGYVAVWLWGYVAMWLCGYVAMRPCSYVPNKIQAALVQRITNASKREAALYIYIYIYGWSMYDPYISIDASLRIHL